MIPPASCTLRHFRDDGRTPNHPQFPLVVQHVDELASADDPAAWLEERLLANGWSGSWRWGVDPFHHFHSNTHEVLGVFSGQATLLLGGEEGEVFEVRVGDVVVLPAGVGHQCLQASHDFQVVGAYPGGTTPDLQRSGEADMEAARARISRVPLPETDPIHGPGGPLLRAWNPD